MGKLWKKSKCFSSLNKLLSFISKSLIYSWKQWSAISTNKSLLAEQKFRHWFLLNFKKILFWFQRATANCLPSFAPRCALAITPAPRWKAGCRHKSQFPQVTDIPTSLEHLQEPTLHNVLSTSCFTVGLHCRIDTQQHQAKPQTLRSQTFSSCIDRLRSLLFLYLRRESLR